MLVLVLVFNIQANAIAAEIRGNIVFASENETDAGNALENQSIGITAYPLDGQKISRNNTDSYKITIKRKKFIPPFLIINRGNTVTFINKDNFFHVLMLKTHNKEHSFILKNIQEQKTHAFSFSDTEDWFLFCKLHKNNLGRIKVVNTPYILNLYGTGNFEFTNMPAGQWKVNATNINDFSTSIVTRAYTSPPVVKLVMPANYKAGSLAEEITLTNNEMQLFFRVTDR